MLDTEGHDLGRFVCSRQRNDGGHWVAMVVPQGLRPEGWPKSIRLPEIGCQIGSLDDHRFIARVRADAIRLNERLDVRRQRFANARASDKTLPALAARYFASPKFQVLVASRQYRNRRNIEKILQWSASRKNPEVSTITLDCVDDFLSRYRIGSATRYDMRATFSVLLTYAQKHMKWISEHPLAGGEWYTPEPEKLRLWTWADAVKYSEKASGMGHHGLAAMIIVMMSTGQRPGDMRTLKWGDHYTGDRLVFRQSKTGKKTRRKMNLVISAPLRKVISSAKTDGSTFLFNDCDTGTGFTAAQLSRRFNEVRLALTEEGEELLLLRSLRHSCVCRLLMTGESPAAVAAVTGHSLFRMHGIIERYFIDRTGAAEKALRAAFVAQGNQPEDFGEVLPLEPHHWVFGDERRRTFKMPEVTEKNFLYLWAARTGQNRRGFVYPPPFVGSVETL